MKMKHILAYSSVICFVMACASLSTADELRGVEIMIDGPPLEDDQYLMIIGVNGITEYYAKYPALCMGSDASRYFYDLPSEENIQTYDIYVMKKKTLKDHGVCVSTIEKFCPILDRTILYPVSLAQPGSPAPTPAPPSNRIVITIDYTIDHDGDGLGATQELYYLTNDMDPDSDHDFLDDYLDIFGTNITIVLPGTNYIVSTAATDPLNPDSDGDGALDGEEVFATNGYCFVTDPCNPDTDGDGVLDGLDPNPLGSVDANNDGIADDWVAFWQAFAAEYGYPADWLALLLSPDADPDGDGLTNRQEYQRGTNPLVPNGQQKLRPAAVPLVVEAERDMILTASFEIVNLSGSAVTGSIYELTQPWAGRVMPDSINWSLQPEPTEDAETGDLLAYRFFLPAGGKQPFSLVIIATNVQANTVYTDILRLRAGDWAGEFPVALQVETTSQPNHAPALPSLSSPGRGTFLPSVSNQLLCWQAALDPNPNDTVTYDVRCSAYHYGLTPELMTAGVTGTETVAFGFEDGLSECLNEITVYEWQVVAKDTHGAATVSRVHWFGTQGENIMPPVTIPDEPLPDGQVGAVYRERLKAVFGWPLYRWRLAEGTLPAGLSLDENGTLSGTSQAAGTSTFTVAVTDQRQETVTQTFSLTVTARETTDAGTIRSSTIGK